jgi:hypothetical protein
MKLLTNDLLMIIFNGCYLLILKFNISYILIINIIKKLINPKNNSRIYLHYWM